MFAPPFFFLFCRFVVGVALTCRLLSLQFCFGALLLGHCIACTSTPSTLHPHPTPSIQQQQLHLLLAWLFTTLRFASSSTIHRFRWLSSSSSSPTLQTRPPPSSSPRPSIPSFFLNLAPHPTALRGFLFLSTPSYLLLLLLFPSTPPFLSFWAVHTQKPALAQWKLASLDVLHTPLTPPTPQPLSADNRPCNDLTGTLLWLAASTAVAAAPFFLVRARARASNIHAQDTKHISVLFSGAWPC